MIRALRILRCLSYNNPPHSIAAAFYHTLAVAHLQDRSYAGARAAALAAVAAWPGSHLSMLDDPRLDGLF